MKGFDTFPNPKETKIGKLIYNLKKPVKSRILEEEYDRFDIEECKYGTHPQTYPLNGEEYIHQSKNFLTDDILYCSLEDLAEESDHEDDAVINIRPRSRTLHSISEVSLSDDSIEATSPPRSPPKDREKDSSQEHYHPSYYVVEDNELEMYLQPNHINTLQQYNYAHLDASKLLNKVENMKDVKSTNQHIPIHRARLGSTPTIVHHSQEFVDAKHPNACKSRNYDVWNKQPSNSCECSMADKIKRSRSVDEILFSHARNSSSYNKFKKSKCTEPSCRFAKYIRINNVEYKVPSNVPKHDPPDLEPAPALPPKRCSSKMIQESQLDAPTAEIKDCDIVSSDVVEPKPIDTQPTQTTKDFDIEEKLEELENMIKELRQCEKQKEDDIVECPIYVNDSSYLDMIRQKRRQKLSSQMSLFRNRFESCPCSDSSAYNNLGRDNHVDTFSSATLPHMNKKKYDKPFVVHNSYIIKMDSPQPVRRNDTHDYELFISIRKGTAHNNNDVYSTPLANYSTDKTLSDGKNHSSSSSKTAENEYLYAHPFERNLKEKTDYQYAYGHTHILHPVAKRDASSPTTKTTPHSTYGKFHYTRSNVNACDVTNRDECVTYENIKCFGNTPETAPTDINNNIDSDNLLQVPQFDINKNVHRIHEYAYVTPSCELKGAANSTPTQQPKPKGTNKSENETLSLGRVGSSYKKFQSKLDYLLPNGRFAKYVNVEGSDLEYKIPSNVPKFNPPELTPPNVLFKDKSLVNYENPVQLSFSSDNIDEMISVEKTKER